MKAGPPVIWDLALRKRLAHGGSSFDLDLAFSSDARRLALVGPSGAGKTQTLRMLAGLLRPDGGHVHVAGRALFDSQRGLDLSPQHRRLACMFQDYALFPHLTVRQNIGFATRTGWLNPRRAAASESVERWIETFNLQAVSHHHPHQISGGQRQRTALARALVHDPAALLLDEPFSALDKALRSRLRDELRDLQAQVRLPMLLITHDDEDLRVLADQVVTLAGGKVADGDQARA